MSIFKRLDNLRDENEELKQIIRDQEDFFASIIQKCNEYKKKNLCVSYVGFNSIKDLAEKGMDLYYDEKR